GQAASRQSAEPLTVPYLQSATIDTAKAVRLLQDRIEDRCEVAGRGIDDLQHFGGRGLLLQGLARLGQQPRVLRRDDRLRREILQQRDLLVSERAHFLAIDAEYADDPVVLAQRDTK